jgi:hypothetical protein
MQIKWPEGKDTTLHSSELPRSTRKRYDTAMWLPFCFTVALLLAVSRGDRGERSDVYVVYMGAVPPRTSPNILQNSHLRLVGSILKRCACSEPGLYNTKHIILAS